MNSNNNTNLSNIMSVKLFAKEFDEKGIIKSARFLDNSVLETTPDTSTYKLKTANSQYANSLVGETRTRTVIYSNLQPMKYLLRSIFLYVRNSIISLACFNEICQLLLVRYIKKDELLKLEQTIQILISNFTGNNSNLVQKLEENKTQEEEEELEQEIEDIQDESQEAGISQENDEKDVKDNDINNSTTVHSSMTKDLTGLKKCLESAAKTSLINRAEASYIEALLREYQQNKSLNNATDSVNTGEEQRVEIQGNNDMLFSLQGELNTLNIKYAESFTCRNRGQFHSKHIRYIVSVRIQGTQLTEDVNNNNNNNTNSTTGVVAKQSVWVDVSIQIPRVYPEQASCIVNFHGSEHINSSELMALTQIIQRMNKFSTIKKSYTTALELCDKIQEFVNDLYSSLNDSNNKNQFAGFPYFPHNFNVTHLTRETIRPGQSINKNTPIINNNVDKESLYDEMQKRIDNENISQGGDSTVSIAELSNIVLEGAKHKIAEYRRITKRGNEEPIFEIVACENVLSKPLMRQFYTKHVELCEKHDKNELEYYKEKRIKPKKHTIVYDQFLYPQLAFHGTSSRSNVNSIAENGLLIPGSITKEGMTIEIASGSRFGQGIYTSPKFEKSLNYAYTDYKGYEGFQGGGMFVCLVILGRKRIVTDGTDYDGISSLYFDSHHSEDGLEYIVFDNAQVLPVYLITYQPIIYLRAILPVKAITEADEQKIIKRIETEAEKAIQTRIQQQFTELSKALRRKKMNMAEQGIWWERIPNTKDKWILSFRHTKQQILKTKQEIQEMKQKDEEQKEQELKENKVKQNKPKEEKTENKENKEEIKNDSSREEEEDDDDDDLEEEFDEPDEEAILRSRTTYHPKHSVQSIHCVYLLDKSVSMGSTFSKIVLPGCKLINNSMAPASSSVVLFGETVDYYENISSTWFDSDTIKNTKLQTETNILAGLECSIKNMVNKKLLEEKKIIEKITEEIVIRGEEEKKFRQKQWEKYKFKIFTKKQVLLMCKCNKCKDCMERNEIIENIRLKWEKEAESQLKQEYYNSIRDELPNQLFVFIMISDGADTINSVDTIRKTVKQTSSYLQANNMQCVFKSIGIGEQSSTEIAMIAKTYITSVTNFLDQVPLYYAAKRKDLVMCIKNLAKEFKTLTHTHFHTYLTLTIPEYEKQNIEKSYQVKSGFIHTLDDEPQDSIKFVINNKTSSNLLYTGIPPPHICINWTKVPVYITENYTSSHILTLLQSLVSEIKILAIADKTRDFTSQYKQLRNMVNEIKQSNFDRETWHLLTSEQKIKAMKYKKTLISNIEIIMNELRDLELYNQEKSLLTHNNTAAADWLLKAEKMKFGQKALRHANKRQQLLLNINGYTLNDCVTELKQLFNGDNNHNNTGRPQIDRDWQIKHRDLLAKSIISGLTAYEQLLEIQELNCVSFKLTLIDLLYAYGMIGTTIECFRSESSVINPWNLVINYVSIDQCDSASLMCMLDSGTQYIDSTGQNTSDCVIVPAANNPKPYLKFMKTKLYEAYVATVFTRNPCLILPAQKTAILMITLVKAIEQLMQHIKQPISSTQSSPNLKAIASPTSNSSQNSPVLTSLTPVNSSPILSPSSPFSANSNNSNNNTLMLPNSRNVNNNNNNNNVLVPTLVNIPLMVKRLEIIFNLIFHLRHRLHVYQQVREDGDDGDDDDSSDDDDKKSSEIKNNINDEKKNTINNNNDSKDNNPTKKIMNDYWEAVVDKLFLPNPTQYFTESGDDDISSVCKLLVPLLIYPQAGKLFSKQYRNQYTEIALGLLGETVSRAARIQIKTKQHPDETTDQTSERLIIKALNITEDTIIKPKPGNEPEPLHHELKHNNNYDLNKARIVSGRFFSKTWTNCTPRAVVACLGFAKALHFYQDTIGKLEDTVLNPTKLYDYLQQSILNISMSKFIHDILPTTAPLEVQVALYIQGLKYYKSAKRNTGTLTSLSQPNIILQEIAADSRRLLYNELVAAKIKRLNADKLADKRSLALTIKRAKQSEWLSTHSSVPKIFTEDEVKALNLRRDEKDQLELLPCGLLKHHCCFEECPKYLVNLSTAKDKLVNNRRGGLRKHLKYFFHPRYIYIRAAHQTISKYLQNTNANKLTREGFIKSMIASLITGNIELDENQQKEFFSAVYDSYKKAWPGRQWKD